MKMVKDPVIHEVLAKQYLRSILGISEWLKNDGKSEFWEKRMLANKSLMHYRVIVHAGSLESTKEV